MRRRTAALLKLLLAITVGALVLLPVACGSGQSLESPSPSSSGRVAVLSSPQGGFSIKYPASFLKVEPDVTGEPGLIYQVLLADRSGAQSGGSALDVLGVMVRQMSKPAGPGDLKKHQREFEVMARQLIGAPAGLKLSPFRVSKLGGQPALKTEYIYKVSGTDVASVAYLVPVGKRAYWVTGQASRATWNTTGRLIGASMQTFELK